MRISALRKYRKDFFFRWGLSENRRGQGGRRRGREKGIVLRGNQGGGGRGVGAGDNDYSRLEGN